MQFFNSLSLRYKCWRYILAILLALLFFGCARHASIPPPPARDSLSELRLQLDRILSDRAFQNAFWGVAIQSLDRGELLYEQNSEKLMMPASNMKILTAAVSLRRLGPEFVYETSIRTDGNIQNGTLFGNLIVIGSGDPTISSRLSGGDHFQVFHNWASRFRQAGIERIEGDIVGVDDAFDEERIGYGWSWDDLPYYYATQIGALQFAENAITITLHAGKAGESVQVQKDPDTSYVQVIPQIEVQDGAEVSVKWKYIPESRTVYATGILPSNGQDYGSFSISNPAAYFVQALKETLARNGIPVSGKAYRGADRKFQTPQNTQEIILYRSPPLRDMLSVLLKVSQNLYAETLLKTLGKGSFDAGVREMESAISELGIPPQSFIIRDASGLSRYNYVTPATLMKALEAMYRDSLFEFFFSAFPVAGVDGTLQSRMKGTPADHNVRAKTGSIANVRSVSGYVRTRDHEMVGFVLIANNFNVSGESATSIQDRIIGLLAGFSRGTVTVPK